MQVFDCKNCKRLFRNGTWLLYLIQDDARYLIGVNPRVVCCGENQGVLECFDTEVESLDCALRIKSNLERTGTTSSLVLYPVSTSSDTLH
jgi:hypothetical protein